MRYAEFYFEPSAIIQSFDLNSHCLKEKIIHSLAMFEIFESSG